MFTFVSWFSWPVLNDYVNRIISSNIRATVLSIKNLTTKVVLAISLPFIWWIVDVHSLSQAFLVSWITFFVFGIISLIFLHKNKVF